MPLIRYTLHLPQFIYLNFFVKSVLYIAEKRTRICLNDKSTSVSLIYLYYHTFYEQFLGKWNVVISV